MRAKDFLTYPVGQVVGDMNEEITVKQVVFDLMSEMVEAKERFDGMIG